MYKKIILILCILLSPLVFSQTIIKDTIIVDLTQSKDHRYKIRNENSHWEIAIKVSSYKTEIYGFDLEEEVNISVEKLLSPLEFDNFILDLYHNTYPNREFDIGRMYAGNLDFTNLFIKVNIDNVTKYFKVKFSMGFITI